MNSIVLIMRARQNRNGSLTLNKLIEVVESNAFWEENLKQYELMSKYF